MLRGFSLVYPFYFVTMALYMPTFTTAAPPPIFIIWRDARLNFAIFLFLQICILVMQCHYSMIKVVIKKFS